MKAMAQYKLARLEQRVSESGSIYVAVLEREKLYDPRTPKNELPASLVVEIEQAEFDDLLDRMKTKAPSVSPIRFDLSLTRS